MAMKRTTRDLILVMMTSMLAFVTAVTVINVRSNHRIRAEVAAQVTQTTKEANAAMCDLLSFSATPFPRPPQPKTPPESEFGKQLAAYNALQATRLVEYKAKVDAAIKRYHC